MARLVVEGVEGPCHSAFKTSLDSWNTNMKKTFADLLLFFITSGCDRKFLCSSEPSHKHVAGESFHSHEVRA